MKEFKEKVGIPFPIQREKWLLDLAPDLKKSYNNILNKGKIINLDEVNNIICNTYVNTLESEISKNVCKIYIQPKIVYNMCFQASWKQTNYIYRFENNFFKLLTQDTENNIIPINIIRENLPKQSFFIDNRFVNSKGVTYRGCYVALMPNKNGTEDLGLFLVEDNEDSDFCFLILPLSLDDKKSTLKDLMEVKQKETLEFYKQNMKEKEDKAQFLKECEEDSNVIIALCTQVMACIIYLCSEEKDIITYSLKSKPKEKLKYKVTENKVGYNLGLKLQQYNKQQSKQKDAQNFEEKSSTKAPHIRKAHYHLYWIGSKKDNTRRLVLKFIHPIFVNKDKLLST